MKPTYYSLYEEAVLKKELNPMQAGIAVQGMMDYSVEKREAEHKPVIYAGAERKGKRKTQEDRMVHFELTEAQLSQFRTLSKIDKQLFISGRACRVSLWRGSISPSVKQEPLRNRKKLVA